MGKSKKTARYNVVSIRVTDDERKRLQRLASKTNLNISDVMRQAMVFFPASMGSSNVTSDSWLNSFLNG